MLRLWRPSAEILGRLDETDTEHYLPNAIDLNARSQRRFAGSQPASKRKSIGKLRCWVQSLIIHPVENGRNVCGDLSSWLIPCTTV